MPMSNYAWDKFVSQHVSELWACTLPSLAEEFPQHAAWLSAFVMKRIFHNHIPENRAAIAFLLLRRTEAAFDEWDQARATLVELARQKTVSGYFKALRHLENAVAALYQGYDLAHNMGITLFTKGDGSALERLNFIYNEGRHFKPDELQDGDLHAVWIANDGLSTREKAITFEELHEQLQQMGRIANAIATGAMAHTETERVQ